MTQPTTAAIRRYLTAAYSDDELTTLCADHFPAVYTNFTAGMTKTQKIRLLLDHCERHKTLTDLAAALQKDRPGQYQSDFPQVALEPATTTLSPSHWSQRKKSLVSLVLLTALIIGTASFVLLFRGLPAVSNRETPTHASTLTPSAMPTAATTPTATITIALTATQPPAPGATATRPPSPTPLPIPQGHTLYDDFTDTNTLAKNWELSRPTSYNPCRLPNISDGRLTFNCANPIPNEDLTYSLAPRAWNKWIAELAVSVQVEKGGAFRLVTNWQCPDANRQRTYAIEWDYGEPVKVLEFKPPNPIPAVLGQNSVTQAQPHILRFARHASGPIIFIDDQPIIFTQVPDFAACQEMERWGLDLYVRHSNYLQGWLDWVSVRNPSGISPLLNRALSRTTEAGSSPSHASESASTHNDLSPMN